MEYLSMLKLTGILNVLRAQTVKRWTIVNTHKQQSLAEHSFNVAMISMEICSRLGMSNAAVIRAALVHDLEEILTGDMPSPFKRYAETRSMVINGLCSVPEEISCLTDTERLILKAADAIENTWFISEFASGSHAKQVAKEQLHWFKYEFLQDTFMGEFHALGLTVNDVFNEMIEGRYVAWPGGKGTIRG